MCNGIEPGGQNGRTKGDGIWAGVVGRTECVCIGAAVEIQVK